MRPSWKCRSSLLNQLTPKISIREMTSSLLLLLPLTPKSSKMNQIQILSSQDVVKVPPTLDKIPEDVQLAIIKFIQSWKRSEGPEEEREKGKRWVGRHSLTNELPLQTLSLLKLCFLFVSFCQSKRWRPQIGGFELSKSCLHLPARTPFRCHPQHQIFARLLFGNGQNSRVSQVRAFNYLS